MPYHIFFCSAGADPEHRGRGKQEDRRGGVSVLQAGSHLPWWKSKTTRDPAVPLYLLPRRAQKQQGPGSVSLLALIDLQGLWFVCLWGNILKDTCSSLPQYRLLGPLREHHVGFESALCIISLYCNSHSFSSITEMLLLCVNNKWLFVVTALVKPYLSLGACLSHLSATPCLPVWAGFGAEQTDGGQRGRSSVPSVQTASAQRLDKSGGDPRWRGCWRRHLQRSFHWRKW